jgi:hypothetical protein
MYIIIGSSNLYQCSWNSWWLSKQVSQLPDQLTIAGPSFWTFFYQLLEYSYTVPQKSVLETLLLHVLSNDLCDVINYCRHLYSADDMKVYLVFNSPKDLIYYSVILILYEVGALLTTWNSILIKLKLYPSQVKLTYFHLTKWLYAKKLERIQQKFAALCFNGLFPHIHYNYSNNIEQLKWHTDVRCIMSIHCPLFKFILFLHSAVRFWKLLVFEILLYISTNFLYSMFTTLIKVILLLNALHLLMSFIRTPTYLENKLFIFIAFCNFIRINVYIYIYLPTAPWLTWLHS